MCRFSPRIWRELFICILIKISLLIFIFFCCFVFIKIISLHIELQVPKKVELEVVRRKGTIIIIIIIIHHQEVEMEVVMKWWWWVIVWSLHGLKDWWQRHSLEVVGSTRIAERMRRTSFACSVALVSALTAFLLIALIPSSRYTIYYFFSIASYQNSLYISICMSFLHI